MARKAEVRLFGKTVKLTDTQVRNAINRIVSSAGENFAEALASSFLPANKKECISKLFADRMKNLT